MEYEIRQLLFDDNGKSLNQMLELQHIVYGDKIDLTHLPSFKSWYLENPMGKVISFNAFFEGELVAHYACVPINMKIGDHISLGLLDVSTVTHPEHRGKGLFRKLAETTYQYASENGYEFVVGVANDNSFPGYMKYFNFTHVCKLDVKWGWGRINVTDKLFSGYWSQQSIDWRLQLGKYKNNGHNIFGKYGIFPLIKVFVGRVPYLNRSLSAMSFFDLLIRPFNLYVGCGADLSQGHYFNFPSFIKHSPFNLIFMDLTGGKLPSVTQDNIVYQLIDFDVI